jgi:predicted Zn-ribbon and HTH transcriptional regulator
LNLFFGICLIFAICDLEFVKPRNRYLQIWTMGTVRQQIVELLTHEEMDARDLSQAVGIKEKEVYAHLAHIARSVAAMGSKLAIRPSECLKCGYVFKDRRRFTRPGRCPRCRESHLTSPFYRISSEMNNE